MIAVVIIKSWEAGPFNLLVVYTDGSVRCTGDTSRNQCGLPDAVASGQGVTDLAMGAVHGTAVVNGRVEAWGNPGTASATEVPDDALSYVIDVASGLDHSIAVKRIDASTTRLIRWGRTDSGLDNVPDRSDVVAVSAGNLHVIALTTSGSVLSWGSVINGLGNVPPEAGSGIVAIAVGEEHSMALTSEGRVLAWGGINGQSNVPAEAQSNVIKIDAASQYCLALRNDGRVIAWGLYTVNYEQGVGYVQVPTTPSGMDSGVVDIAALAPGFIARKQGGSVVAFGVDGYAILGFPTVL
jgi:alpha-tubulin suppressor-like RCC1 family protein